MIRVHLMIDGVVKRVQKLGKRVENAYFHVSASALLKRVCDSSVPLDGVVEYEK